MIEVVPYSFQSNIWGSPPFKFCFPWKMVSQNFVKKNKNTQFKLLALETSNIAQNDPRDSSYCQYCQEAVQSIHFVLFSGLLLKICFLFYLFIQGDTKNMPINFWSADRQLFDKKAPKKPPFEKNASWPIEPLSTHCQLYLEPNF